MALHISPFELPRHHGRPAARVALLSALVLVLVLLLPIVPATRGPGGAPGPSSAPRAILPANGGHCAKPASVIIPSVAPTGSVAVGDTLSVSYEIEITRGTAPLTIYFPRIYANFPMAGGGTTVASVAPNTLTGVTTSWTNGSAESATHTFTASGSFASGATAELTSELLAVMANETRYEGWNVSVRWSWTLVTGSGTVVSPWTGGTDLDSCPSNFWPAPRVTLLQDGNTSGPPGTIFTAELGGYVAKQYFFLEIETPSGHAVYSQGTTAGATNTTNVTIPFDCWCGQLTPGPYLTHLHNLMGSLLYSISVLVTNPDGLSANVTSNVTAGPNPLAVSFTATAIPGVPPYTYLWSFGDGGSSSSQDPVHTYTQVGNFSANLTIQDARGENAVSSVLITDYTPPDPLVASVTANVTEGVAPLHVQFGSTIAGGLGPYQVSWSFGANRTSDVPDPVETFFGAGFYIVVLNVTDRTGAATSAFIDLTVHPSSGGFLVAVSPGSGHHEVPAAVELQASVTGGVAPYDILWRISGATRMFSGPVVNYTFAAPGTYAIVVNVTDRLGDRVTRTVSYVVYEPLTVVVAELTGTGAVGTPAVIVANVAGGGPITGYHWALNGVPSPINGTRFEFTSTISGSYAVSLRVGDLYGDQATASLLVVVTEHPFGYVPPPNRAAPTAGVPIVGYVIVLAIAGAVLGGVGYAWSRGKRPPLPGP